MASYKVVPFATLILATLVVYAQVRHFDFVNMDDPVYVSSNSHVETGLNRATVAWAFTATEDENWFPLTRLSFLLDHDLYGSSAGGYHVSNVLLHILAAVLLFDFLRRSTGSLWASTIVPVLFALHPLHVESVAWISERKDVLSAVFFFLTLRLYVSYVARPTIRIYGLLLVAYLCALMSKPMVVTLPAILLLLDCWPLRRAEPSRGFLTQRIFLIEKLPLIAPALAISILAFATQRAGGALASLSLYPFEWRVENALLSVWVYIAEVFWPSGLAIPYPYHPVDPLFALLAAVGLIATTIATLRAYRNHPYLAVGWLWYLVSLVPVAGLLQIGSQSRADRYTYLPAVGVFIMMGWGASGLIDRFPAFRSTLTIVSIAICGLFAAITSVQIGYWRDSGTLFTRALTVTKSNSVAYTNLAEFDLERELYEDALSNAAEAVRLQPDLMEAQMNLGAALDDLGRGAESEIHFRAALGIQPRSAKAHSWLGVSLFHQGKVEEARREEETAIKLDPQDPDGYDHLGVLLESTDRNSEALKEFSEAVRLRPTTARFHYNFGTALATAARFNDAIPEFRAAARLNPGDLQNRLNLGSALAMSGDLDQAIAEFTFVIQRNPGFPGAQQSLQNALTLKQH